MNEPTIPQAAHDLATKPDGKPPERAPTRPWRTEGLPPDGKGEPPKKERNWWTLATRAFVIYLVVFGLLTLQDRLNGPQTVTYSEFDRQVQAGNVVEVFARGQTIQGKLREAKPLPDDKEGRT
ncbi:MAG TPA: ATP-dependent metallopeptidase FtsH/Yme1/Tma family protein, partial [Polyangiaceae bacterium]|nr:ATP-dependent metallopeptidase FtsH/Yme1/Tma family protein [Polyangiaceae bacterium]